MGRNSERMQTEMKTDPHKKSRRKTTSMVADPFPSLIPPSLDDKPAHLLTFPTNGWCTVCCLSPVLHTEAFQKR